MSNDEMELMEHLRNWVKTKQEPRFWETAKRVNLSIMMTDLPEQKRSDLVHGIVILVRLAQLKAFRDGLHKGKRAAANQIMEQCKKLR